ncbi:MAG: hypothetical protein RLZ51_2410, partial [Pseudomonadota bacterium]
MGLRHAGQIDGDAATRQISRTIADLDDCSASCCKASIAIEFDPVCTSQQHLIARGTALLQHGALMNAL